MTNIGSDRAQFNRMAGAAREAMDKPWLQAFADRGYFGGTELEACEDDCITAFVPKPKTSNAKAAGRFYKTDFVSIAKDDEPMPRGVNGRSTCSARWRRTTTSRTSTGPAPALVVHERPVHDQQLPSHPTLGT
ncbi:hypothetical protein J2W32_003714 [Variovorax boronicumulans]|uniref:Transposase DDE domain-containing protein n=1 Tax=Variovorax boronicumulans TaxID=436515 RepID=A0AAW8D6Y1_9BURK|nr:hypothetical protein [Variovorax boronicumulans]MDP9895025.1 hypothetical protein [Variovorax boronicumulans]MDP9993990.1 hypothetical protein [Variovorax boronicumulans]MDQ0005147.1 hypothetical protein [Variovorax boronicumulans]MDQ0038518.1 hypothetical protein [Variovorax boronicumulans]MDQ0044682.1 hypothetical protein [Variovorax boronicumulans]